MEEFLGDVDFSMLKLLFLSVGWGYSVGYFDKEIYREKFFF